MGPRFRLLGWLVVMAAAGMATAEVGKARSQGLTEGWNKLYEASRKGLSRYSEFRNGRAKVDPENKADVEVIDLVAKVHTYGPALQHLEEDKQRGKLNKAFQDFARDVDSITKSKDRESLQAFTEVFREKIRLRALDVIKSGDGVVRPIHKIYNAHVLAKVAELGQGALSETLIELLKDKKQNDAVRYWALRGLTTLLAQVQPMQMPPVMTKEQVDKCGTALVEFLESRKGPSKNAPQEEIDGFCVLRREAVRALALVHVPKINDKVRPALVLARVAGSDGRMQPPPRVDERLEAAIGLARMQTAQDKRYQADYAAGQIAKAIGAVAEQFNKEVELKEALRTRPWRADAGRMKDALEVLKANNGQNAFVAQVVDRGTKLVQDIIRGRAVKAEDVTWFISEQSDPPSKELFQGVSDSIVKPGTEAEAAPEK
jgi:hypothetical protein